MRAFQRLGVLEKFRAAGFMEKFGGEMASTCCTEGVRFYFEDGFRSKCDRSYQVPRAEFDKLLLDHAAENGAEVHEQTLVENVDFGGDEVRLRVSGLSKGEIRARYLIDASGRQAFVGGKFQLKQNYENLQKFSIFAHYSGVTRPQGRDGTLTRMIRGNDRWFWMIPLSADRMSIGVVLDAALFRAQKQSPQEFLTKALAEQPLIAACMNDAQQLTSVYTAADFSYRNKELAGERWLLAGDAAGFIDPVFSSGVFLAIMAAELAADAVHEALARPARARRLFTRYERRVNHALDVYIRFVRSWYRKEFIEVFLHPQDVLQIPPAVNALLGGNIHGSIAIKWRIWIFYGLVWLQKYLPIAPRRTLLPTGGGKPQPESALQPVS
jgi:flavin-dependent dehydrogenase